METKKIGFITEDKKVFLSRASLLSSHDVRWIKPDKHGELPDLRSLTELELVIIESEDNALRCLKKLRAYMDIPIVLISRKAQSELQAKLTEAVGVEKLVIEFGKYGVYYCYNDSRLELLNAIIEEGSKNTDYGDTRKLLMAIQQLRNFRHGGWKRVVGIQLRLETLTDESSYEEREKLVQRVQDIHDEVHRPLQQLREAGIDTEQCFPKLIKFEKECATMLMALTNPGSDKLKYLKKMADIFVHH